MIPIAENAMETVDAAAAPTTKPSELKGYHLTDYITALMLASLRDPYARTSDMFLLRTVRSSAVVTAARAALDDPDLDMQRSALCCLAGNGVVDVIPRMADAIASAGEHTSSSQTLLAAFRDFDEMDATPYLNQLLVDARSASVRNFAAMTLNQNQLADKTSIPFLLAMLKDPNSTGLGPFYADIILHRLIPSLGPHGNQTDFEQHRQSEIDAVDAYLKSSETADGNRQGEETGIRACPDRYIPKYEQDIEGGRTEW